MLEHKSTENENFSGSKERVKEENCIQNFLQHLQNSIQKTIQNFLFFFYFPAADCTILSLKLDCSKRQTFAK